MRSIRQTLLVHRLVAQKASSRSWLHSTAACRAITNLEMPAMSPTMTEGGISSWKKKEGESYTAGDVLLEIETDKATIDVEAQDDGVVGKILAPDGTKNIPIGKVIALLAEEGDDISNLEAPQETPRPPKQDAPSPKPEAPSEPTAAEAKTQHPPTPKPTKHIEHSRPLFPSVLRLLQENDVPDLKKIKGTGVRGMLTKGDVLAFLGKASSPFGTFKEVEKKTEKVEKKEEIKPLDGPALRRLIVSNMLQTSLRARSAAAPPTSYDFGSIISDYLPSPPSPPQMPIPSAPRPKSTTSDYLDGLI